MSIYSDTEIPTVYYTPEDPNENELSMLIDNSENIVYISASNNDAEVMHMCVPRSDITIRIGKCSISVRLFTFDGALTFYVKELEVITDGHDPTEGLDIREL